MTNRRRILRFACIAVALGGAWLTPSSDAGAQQGFQQFTPLLIDLPGWTGKKADGVSMQLPGNNNMITAIREYRRGDAQFSVQIIVGAAAQGALASLNTGMKFETSEGRMNTSTVDGLRIMQAYTTKNKSGTIIVALASSAMLSAAFKGLAEDEALALARKFNWKAIQAAVPK